MLVAKRLCPTVALWIAGSVHSTHAAEPAQKVLDLRRQEAVHGSAEAGATKAEVCGGCHGPQGNAPVPEFPSLAGQSATYLYLQLRAYKDGTRPSDIMRPLVEPLSDQDMRDLSAYYASLRAQRSAAASEGNTDAGQALFARGNPAAGVPPCQGCHGVVGKGPQIPAASAGRPTTACAALPSLAGQQPQYIVTALKAYQSGARSGTTNTRIMHGVVQPMDETAMQEVAAYLGQLSSQ